MRFLHLGLVLVLYFSSVAVAADGEFAYRVSEPSKTLIQIARDIYSDERMWKDIAYWNGLQPPFELSTGAVLIMRRPAVRPVPASNLATVPPPTSPKAGTWPSVAQELEQRSEGWFYTVNERAPSLAMVSRELYGDLKGVREIALANGLEVTSRLALGQRLKLPRLPVTTPSQADAILVEQWRSRGNKRMVARLLGAEPAEIKTTSAPSTSPVAAPDTRPTAAPAHPPAAQSAARPAALPKEQPASHPEPVKPRISAPKSAAKPVPQAPHPQPQAKSQRRVVPRPGKPVRVEEVEEEQPTTEYAFKRQPAAPEQDLGVEPKDESYWLGDSANDLIEVISRKLRELEISK